MPDAMFLQIQGGGSSTMRMIELPAGPVRIGRGAACEVRLVDNELADVQCILRLRGTTWHYQPVGPSGRVWIDGRAAEEPRTVNQGVPFRVGDHWLTLRSAQNAFNDWVSYDDPAPFVPDPSMAAAVLSEVAADTARTKQAERPLPASTPDETEERLRRWQARLEQRERWLKDKQDERRWEARWKSAGESIRARSGSSAKTPPSRSTTPGAPTVPSERLKPAQTPPPPPTPRPLQTPPVSRIIETRPSEPTRRASDPSLRTPSPRPTIRPLPEPPAVFRRPVESSTVRVPSRPTIRVVPPVSKPIEPPPPISRAIVTLPTTALKPPSVRVSPVESPAPIPVDEQTPIVGSEPVEVPVAEPELRPSFFELIETAEINEIVTRAAEPEWVAPVSDVLEASEEARIADEWPADPTPSMVEAELQPSETEAQEPEILDEVAPLPVPIIEPEHPVTVELVEPALEAEPEPVVVVVPLAMNRIEPSAWVEELTDAEIEAEAIEARRLAEVLATPTVVHQDRVGRMAPPEISTTPPSAIDLGPVAAESRTKRWSERPPADRPTGVGPSKTEYPSARAIFAAQGRRAQPAPVVSRPGRRRSVEPLPTECLAPPQWTMPLWLGWVPTLFATLIFGSAGTWLAYEWMAEAGGSNVGLRLALRPDTPSSPLIDPSLIPRGGWFFSTPTHFAAWAVALERANDGENHAEDVRLLIAAAREASPLGARTRFHVEASQGSASPIDPNDFSAIGRTRDVVSLISTGGRLREANKLESSIRAYRSAMELALMAAREGLEPPVFDENNEVRRYSLPHEALLGLVVRDMAERGDWTIEQWTSALPASASASWVASKVLARLKKKAIADALADLAIRQAETLPPPGFDPAEHRAAVAEALAYRGRWTDSAEQYRQAIDQVEDDTTRRSWWFNLAELAHRMSDDPAQAMALEAAKSPDLADEITQRARKALESQPGLLVPGPRR